MVNFQMKSNKYKEEVVMGFNVFSDHLSKIPIRMKPARVVSTISPNSYGLSTKISQLDRALKGSDYLVLDGVYFALASIVLRGRNIKKNQGPDVFYHFMDRLNNMGGTAFFLGSTQKTLDLIKQQTNLEFPNIKLFSLSPPFTDTFSTNEEKEMIDSINAVHPDIVFVGMTCPKQEVWSVQNKDKIDAGLIVCIGNVFDWFAGTQRPIHPIWFSLRLGWLVRIFLRPEIFKRNIGNQLKFFRHLFMIILGIKKEPVYIKP